ncbi:AAA family ATPase [Frankia sp. CiP1_Cm_nod2]|uniref:AAA family ATPase n=1 Tax=Frankia sp. CiP1_Cm_nod2 TaxID=2897161 RepID=UPI00202510FE
MAATVERLAEAVRPGGDAVFVLYGIGTDDVFVSRDYQERGIEEALWEELRAGGFDRVAFCSARDSLYFRDADSAGYTNRARSGRRHPRPARTPDGPAPDGPAPDGPASDGSASDGPASAAGAGRAGGMRYFSGPQGRRMQLRSPASVSGVADSDGPLSGAAADYEARPAAAVSAPRRRTGMRDTFLIQMLEHYMTQDEVRTAVAVVRADQFLAHVGERRAFSEALGRWITGPRTGNVCLLLFHHRGWDRVVEEVRGLGGYSTLAEFLDDQSQRRSGRACAQVGEPTAAELERLVHLVRLRHGLCVADWAEIPRLAAAMAGEGALGARRWLHSLTGLARAGIPLSARELRARGELTTAMPDGRDAWERLDELTGLAPVKEHLRRLARRMALEDARRAAGRAGRAEAQALHLVFTGNPGTGKTTVARLVGEIYQDLGVLRRGHLVSAEVSDLVAGFVGQTAINTNRLVDEALDGVLFIDEAYRLTEQAGGFGQEAIDALLTRMENDRDRLVVIVAGYPVRMTDFLGSNPGLRSRFPAANVVDFPDFSPDELLAILLGELTRAELAWTPELADELRQAVTGLHRVRDGSFGNARTMRELAAELRDEWSQRVFPAGGVARLDAASAETVLTEPLRPADIPERYRVYLRRAVPRVEEVLAEFDTLVGMGAVKDVLRGLVARLRHRQRLGSDGVLAPHLLFVGPPGTGKTTVARLLGRMLHSLGLLGRGHVVEVTRERLVAGYVGQTASRTEERIQEALDGVLFIDEAYSLARGGENDFGQEAVDTLVPAMENLRGRLVVIAAGYPAAMDAFLARNEGLSSRFTERVEFPGYTVEELAEILRRMASDAGYTLSPAAGARASGWLRAARSARLDDFGNGRAVRTLLDRMEARLAERTLSLPDGAGRDALTTFLPDDVPAGPPR